MLSESDPVRDDEHVAGHLPHSRAFFKWRTPVQSPAPVLAIGCFPSGQAIVDGVGLVPPSIVSVRSETAALKSSWVRM